MQNGTCNQLGKSMQKTHSANCYHKEMQARRCMSTPLYPCEEPPAQSPYLFQSTTLKSILYYPYCTSPLRVNHPNHNLINKQIKHLSFHLLVVWIFILWSPSCLLALKNIPLQPVSHKYFISTRMLPQWISRPECPFTDVAWKGDAFKMVCFNVVSNVHSVSFLPTYFASSSSLFSIWNKVGAFPHHWFHLLIKLCQVCRKIIQRCNCHVATVNFSFGKLT